MTQLCLCVRLGSQLRRLERMENSASFKNEVGGWLCFSLVFCFAKGLVKKIAELFGKDYTIK
jgi:hypothetical protein